MLFGGILIIGSSILGYKEFNIIKKKREIKCAYDVALKKFPIVESIGTGIDSSGLSLFDIYDFYDNHDEILGFIKNIFTKNNLGSSPLNWHDTVEKLFNHGSKVIDSNHGDYIGQTFKEAAFDSVDNVSNIHNAGSVMHHIPVMALAIFGFKTTKNLTDYQKNKLSNHELKVNIALDIVGVGTKATAAVISSKVGSAIGSAVPGVGNVVGGGIGAVAGAMIAPGLDKVKEKLKWKDIIEALDHYGNIMHTGFNGDVKNKIKLSLLDYNDAVTRLSEEERLLKTYKEQLDYTNGKKVTVEAVLCKIEHDRLNVIVNNIDDIVNEAEKGIYDFCGRIASKVSRKKKKGETIKKRFLGELIINNPEMFLKDEINEPKRDAYLKNLSIAPNHPYKLENHKEILNSIIQNTSKIYADKILNNYVNEYSTKKHIPKLMFIVFLFILGIII